MKNKHLLHRKHKQTNKQTNNSCYLLGHGVDASPEKLIRDVGDLRQRQHKLVIVLQTEVNRRIIFKDVRHVPIGHTVKCAVEVLLNGHAVLRLENQSLHILQFVHRGTLEQLVGNADDFFGEFD